MALRAKKPETVEKRLKMFLYGTFKVGKTIAALHFPNCYVIDTERGAVHEQYVKLMQANGSEVMHSNDAEEIIDEIRALGTTRHNFKTVVIDPITMIEADLIEKAEREFGAGDIRIWGKRDRTLKRMVNLLNKLDMNVIVTAHGKILHGDNFIKLGTTYDGWKRWPFAFDLIVELERRGEERVAKVKGSRIATFREEEEFNWSYEEFLSRYPIIGKDVTPVSLATAEQVAEIKDLLSSVKLAEDTVDKWFTKANVDRFEDMVSDDLQKCINFVKDKLPKGTTNAVSA